MQLPPCPSPQSLTSEAVAWTRCWEPSLPLCRGIQALRPLPTRLGIPSSQSSKAGPCWVLYNPWVSLPWFMAVRGNTQKQTAFPAQSGERWGWRH